MSAPSWLVNERDVLDSIDDQLLDALARRAAQVRHMAERKQREGLPLHDADREAATVARWRERAAALGLDPALAERVARDVIGRR